MFLFLVHCQEADTLNCLIATLKSLINIKINDNKYFLWCHIRHLNPLKMHPERIKNVDTNMAKNLDYGGIEISVSKKDFGKTEKKNNIGIDLFCYENNLAYPVYEKKQKLEDCIYVLMITNEYKSHYVYIEDFNRFMCNKTNHKNRKTLLEILFTLF